MFEVLVADDHPVFRDGLRSLIGKVFDDAHVTEAGDMMCVRRFLDTGPALDLFVLDVYFPGLDVLRDLPKLRRSLALTPIVVISMLSDQELVHKIMGYGVNGFVSKSVPPDVMARSLKAVVDGDMVLRCSMSPQVNEKAEIDPLATLSPRQLEVLTLICRGMSNKEIARDLDLSPYTVRIHVSAMMAALNVTNRTEAAVIGSSRGLC